MSALMERLKAKLADLYAREPARVNAAVSTGLVALLTLGGLVIAPGVALAVAAVTAFLVPELVAELTRPKVIAPATAAALLAPTVVALDPGFEPNLAELEASVAELAAEAEDAQRLADQADDEHLPPDSLGP